MVLLDQLLYFKIFVKFTLGSKTFKKLLQRMYLSKKSIICILWCEFFNNLDAKSDFDKQD